MPVHSIRKFSFLNSVYVLAILICVFVYLNYNIFNEVRNKRSINKEVETLQAELDRINANNTELTSMISFFESEQYVEKQARTKLGYKKSGESVIVLSGTDVTQQTPTGGGHTDASVSQKEEHNVTKWMRYFFGDL